MSKGQNEELIKGTVISIYSDNKWKKEGGPIAAQPPTAREQIPGRTEEQRAVHQEWQRRDRIKQLEDMPHISLRRQQRMMETEDQKEENRNWGDPVCNEEIHVKGSAIIPGLVIEKHSDKEDCRQRWEPRAACSPNPIIHFNQQESKQTEQHTKSGSKENRNQEDTQLLVYMSNLIKSLHNSQQEEKDKKQNRNPIEKEAETEIRAEAKGGETRRRRSRSREPSENPIRKEASDQLTHWGDSEKSENRDKREQNQVCIP